MSVFRAWNPFYVTKTSTASLASVKIFSQRIYMEKVLGILHLFEKGDDPVMILFTILLSAAVTDWRYGKIFHVQIFLGIAAGIVSACMGNRVDGQTQINSVLIPAGVFVLRFAGTCAVFYLFFLCRMIGAGDIKLMGPVSYTHLTLPTIPDV